ncbi:hypothetical protein [Parapedobacter sp. DT-150]|uniref:hypothetical protein n=1 Tax=Parapedobacter sp. DT-150 TaxID=3396162 RepID=UPI003F1B4726
MTKLLDQSFNQYVAIELLVFDLDNQRFASWGSKHLDVPFDPFTALCEVYGVKGLIAAILSGGYFEAEPMLVTPVGSRYVVFDGNRRLAAVHIILNSEQYARYYPNWLPKPTSELLDSLTEIPVIIVPDRQSAWPLLAHRHGMGAVGWDGYAKASFFHRLTDDYLVSDYQVANYLGIGRRELRGFMTPYRLILTAEEAGVWDRKLIEGNRIYYSYVARALHDNRIQRFVGVESLSGYNPADLKLDNIARLLNWLLGNTEKGIRPILSDLDVDIPKLGRVVECEEAVRCLDERGWLDKAYQIAIDRKFPINDQLHAIHNKLWDMLASVPEHEVPYEAEGLAKRVKRVADDLYERVIKKDRKRRN